MRSSEVRFALALSLALGSFAFGDTRDGYAVERLTQASAGGGWIVSDSLSWGPGLGGAVNFSTGYSHLPLTIAVPGQGERLAVVSDQAFAEIGLAVSWQWLRFSAQFSSPLVATGQDGAVGDSTFAAPHVDLQQNPDTISDVHLSLDARIYGEYGSPFRLGVGGQLILPSGEPKDYLSDGTYRGRLRVFAAGERSWLTWAAQLGVHLRPRDDSPMPGGPLGSELLFAGAAGAKIPLGTSSWQVCVGPELFGATALRSAFSREATALEALLSARAETTGEEGVQLRVKLGIGVGLVPAFGAPAWRLVLAVEGFGHLIPKPAPPAAP